MTRRRTAQRARAQHTPAGNDSPLGIEDVLLSEFVLTRRSARIVSVQWFWSSASRLTNTSEPC